jgi:hypothetical protein
MPRYKIWDKSSDIYTPGKEKGGKNHWTAKEYIADKAPWAAIPTVKVIVGSGIINGGVFMEFDATKEFYKKQGANITDGMSDDEVIAAIEQFEDNPPAADEESTAEERIAAALEAQVMLASPNINMDDPDETEVLA